MPRPGSLSDAPYSKLVAAALEGIPNPPADAERALVTANRVARRYLAPVITKFTSDILDDLHRDFAENLHSRGVFVGRDGLSMRPAALQLERPLQRQRTKFVTLSRLLVAAAATGFERFTGLNFPYRRSSDTHYNG
ncbi:MAG TPA: hypothetical protein VHU91_02285 [Mycobacteriales bacterium]|jgi:hypothetical protein|nr:hypothetical protein [Mycobacteriales bacterium]